MPKVLFYEDERALSAYLGGAALLEPALATVSCQSLRLSPSESETQRSALFFGDDSIRLPTPSEVSTGTSLFEAKLDVKKGFLSVGDGRQKQRFSLEDASPARQLAQVLPPIPWSKPPETGEVIYLVEAGEPFAKLVSQHLELGRDDLRYVPVHTGDSERILLEVPTPSWFLLERWLEDHADEARVFRRLIGQLGMRRIYVEWGYEHALESWLSDPDEDGVLLLIDREGVHRTLSRGELADIAGVLDLDPTRFVTEQLEPTEQPERIRISLRLEPRTSPLDPELWILAASQRHRLEELLTQTPEEELRNLLVACVKPEEDEGERMFCVREVLTGRAPRLLPLGERAYAPHPGLPNLLVPCDRVIAPPLSVDRYARSFDLRPSELTILDEVQGEAAGMIEVTKVTERAFRPVDTIVDFVFDGSVNEIEEVMLSAPFDLGRFEEEDLVPKTLAPREKPAKPKAVREKPKPSADDPGGAKRPRKQRLFDKLLKPFRGKGDEEDESAAEQAVDPRQEQIAAIERELVLGTPSAGHWQELSRLQFADGQVDEALRCGENALWELADPDSASALELLDETLGTSGAAAPQDTLDLYRRVFAYRRETTHASADADHYRRATEGVYQDLREHEDRLRKKTRWLLWRLVLRETGDLIEGERQREAILSDLVLRGVEEREVPPFVRNLLLDHYGQKAATGSGASEALAFLERAYEFASSLQHPAFQAEALAHVAWAFAELGQGERAIQIAQQAERQAASNVGAPPHHAYRARAVARVGAVIERVRGRDEGRPQLEAALQSIAGLLPARAGGQSQELVDSRKAIVSWLGAVADAWSTGDRRNDPLLRRGLELLQGRPPNDQATILHEAPEEIRRLGLAETARDMTRLLMQPDELKRARDCVRDLPHPSEAYRVHAQNLMECLELFQSGGSAVTAAESQAIVDILRSSPDLVDEFTIQPLRVALRGSPTSPWDIVQGLADELLRRGLRYEAQLVRIAGLWRLAELRDRQAGPQLLASTLEEAWNLEDNRRKPKHRVITRLVQLVPAFGMRQRGMELLHSVNQRAQDGSHDLFFRNELLLSTSLAASKLGDSRASFELIEEIAQLAMRDFQGESMGTGRGVRGPSWLLFETLDACVDGAAELGETRRGIGLVTQVGDAARAALQQASDGRTEGPYFYCRTLIRCGKAALALGDPEVASGFFSDAFTRLSMLNTFDQTEILQQEAAVTAGQLEGGRRYELARQVVEAARGLVSSGTQDRFAMELTAQVAREMVRGESAFAAALKRWKGREERSIRDVVAHEQFGE